MEKNKPTPGPWKTDPEYDHEIVCGGNGIMVADCSIFHKLRPTHTNQANAHLIAAAPDLKETGYKLAMLGLQSERYLWDSEFKEAVDNHLAAQAKAENCSEPEGRPSEPGTGESHEG